MLHAPLEFHSYEAIYKCLAVNLFGAIEVTNAFLPLIRKAKGRVVYTTSDCAFQSYACRGPYVISKVGLDAMAECLRFETYQTRLSLMFLITYTIMVALLFCNSCIT